MKISVPGFSASGIASGIKDTNKKDLGLILSKEVATAVGVFTTNKIKAAPVVITSERIKQKRCQAIIVNSGNANACTGTAGIRNANDIGQLVADKLGISEKLVLVSSTGIIGVNLPLDKIQKAIPRLVKSLSPQGLNDFSEAILTTDTYPKIVVEKERIDGREVTLCGIIKGSGMVMPGMATLLAFVLTDLAIQGEMLDELLKKEVNKSLNRINIDGDMSTNDMVIMMANGHAGNAPLNKNSADFSKFRNSLNVLFFRLKKLILKDAEGSTKIISIRVKEAKSNEEAKKIVYQVANSNLVKTAFFGEDPNWGRIMAAMGNVEADINPEKIGIHFDELSIVENGISTGKVDQAKEILKKSEFQVTINLHNGSGFAEVDTTDLTPEYVKINSSYPT